ncbi:hypothetical protein SKAU_G00341890 [Synaphobranchus kaupii]|uniref:Glutamate-rich protein 1 n=1 Tax=Synaphobranchus kaupii TaxID=118154 RepID=A0A9Q1EN95_SYNKA|nr:hypothetical protein SKAU_G00341890 [Synaphobranchus kaupii]
MANRKEVFQDKLLRRLYPVPPKGTIAGDDGRNRLPQRRVYTVPPPPEGYRAGDEESAKLTEPGNINTEGDPAAETRDERSPEPSNCRHQRRRRKRKRIGVTGEGGQEERDAGGAGEENVGTAAGDAKISRNKRRKEKKRRRKQRLLSLGLLPNASAVEFTYQPDLDEEEEEECWEKRLAELLDFLQATQEICLSDRCAPETARVPDAAMQSLTAGLAADTTPPADLRRLHRLKALVLLRDAGGLAGALEEFRRAAAMPPAETSAICSLFRYWLTDILPAQSDQKPGGSPAPASAI